MSRVAGAMQVLGTFRPSFRDMAERLGDLLPSRTMPEMSTEELRRNLSQIINRAAYGRDPVLITRRGRKIAALISMHDLALLVQMRLRRDSR